MGNYSELLKNPKWQKKRLEILSRDEFTCQCCRDTEKQLQVHHLEYKGNPWEIENDKLVTLCSDCHLIISSHNITYNEIKYKGSVKYPSGGKSICLIYNNNCVNFYYVVDNSILYNVPFRKNSETIKLIKSMFKYLQHE